jgi:hypothetical protein
MRFTSILAATAIAAFTAGVAVADSSTPAASDQQAAPSASQAAMPAAASIGGPGAVVVSSPTPVDQAYTLKAGDPTVISNNPVPDTKANRALYGPPMSNAGRHTAATGD